MQSIISPNGPFSYLINDADSSSSSTSNYSTSPLGSEMGLPETTTENQDDEVVLAELTRRMAEFTFEDDDDDDNEVTGVCGGYKSSSSTIPPQNPNSDIFSWQNNRNKPQVRKEGSKSAADGRGIMTEEQDQERKAWKRPSSTGGIIIPDCGSGKRAVFLGGSKINSGTGVFLPNANYNKPTKKPAGCSTVIIPARVLQTLQQHFNNVGAKSQSQSSINHHWQNDVLARINGLLSQKQEQAVFQIHPPPPRPVAATIHVDQEELRLPHEWTY